MALFVAAYWNTRTSSGAEAGSEALVMVAVQIIAFFCVQPYYLSLPDCACARLCASTARCRLPRSGAHRPRVRADAGSGHAVSSEVRDITSAFAEL